MDKEEYNISNGANKFLVSIIIPTKQSSKSLEDCLKSIKAQTYPNIEIIVVDNFSNDGTLEIAKKYADEVYIQGPERSVQRNFGAKKSQGDYVLFIDSDMKLSQNVIFSCVEAVKADKSIKSIIIPEESFGVGFWAQCKKLERSFYVGVDWIEAARFFEKKAFYEAGGYDEGMISGEDWDLSQRAGRRHKIGRISELIYHNEGSPGLYRIVKKKFSYAGQIGKYLSKQEQNEDAKGQTDIFKRYKLFFSDTKKLFSNPVIGIGMLFMKTCEFGFGGMGYLIGKSNK